MKKINLNQIAYLLLLSPLNILAEDQMGHNHNEPEEMTTITINADPRDQSLLDSTDPISVMDSNEIRVRAETTLGETLSSQPGVNSNYFGPGSSRPVIRGNSGERIRILKNGVGSQDISNTSEDHQVTINPLTTDSIEVLRGPETLLYGSSAIGGVVNATDNNIPKTQIKELIRGDYNLKTQTVNDEFSGAAKLEGGYKGFNWSLSGLNQVTDNIRIPGFAESSRIRELESEEHDMHDDHSDHSDHHSDHLEEHADGNTSDEDQIKSVLRDSSTRTQTATLGGSYVWDKGYLGLSVTGYNSKYGVPGHAHAHGEHEHHEEENEHKLAAELGHEEDTDHHDEDHAHITSEGESEPGVRIELEQYRVDSRGEFRDLSKSIERVRYSAAFSNYDHAEIEGATAGTRFQNNAFEGRTELTHSKIGNLSGTFGAQFEASDFAAEGEEAFLPNTKRYAPGFFAFEELELMDDNKLALQFGGRIETVSLNPEGNNQDQDFIPISASTGLSWKIDDSSTYTGGLSLAYTERAPAATELYASGIHAARQIAEFGDSNLGIESSLGADITLKKNKGIVTGQLNMFIQEYSDYINLSQTGEEYEGFDSFRYNQIDARFIGFEIESYLHVHDFFESTGHQIDIGGQIDFVKAYNTGNSEDLPRIPPMRFMPKVRYGYEDILSFSVEGVLAAAQTDTAPGELGTSAYQLLNTTLELPLPYLRKNNLMLYARGLNLTNEEARIHSSFIKDLAPLPGRSALIGLSGSF